MQLEADFYGLERLAEALAEAGKALAKAAAEQERRQERRQVRSGVRPASSCRHAPSLPPVLLRFTGASHKVWPSWGYKVRRRCDAEDCPCIPPFGAPSSNLKSRPVPFAFSIFWQAGR